MVFYNFIQFDPLTKLPIYTVFNFNYEKYALDYHIQSTSKYDIFTDFWNRVGFDYSKPYVVPLEFTQYFFTITQEMIDYVNYYGFFHNAFLSLIVPPTYISYDELEKNQFDMIPYTDEQVKRLQDFYYDANKIVYSKHNFNFDSFSNDFLVYGSKLLVMTDFIIRNLALSNVINFSNSNGYGLYSEFAKYFIIQPDRKVFQNYLINYSISSVLKNVPKNFYNIDFAEYVLVNNLQIPVEDAPNEFLLNGQFTQYIVPLLPYTSSELSSLKQSCGVFVSEKTYASGFLVKNNTYTANYFFITTYHNVFDEEDQFYVYGSFQKVNIDKLTTSSLTAQFRIIGIDRISDTIVAVFNPAYPFNVANGIKNLDGYVRLEIDTSYNLQVGDIVYTVGNVGNNDIQDIQKGYIMDANYNGSVNDYYRPPSNLIYTYLSSGCSGAPVLYQRNPGEPFKVVGVIKDKLKNSPNTAISINSIVLSNIVNAMILNYVYYRGVYGSNIVGLNTAIKFGYPTSYLGIMGKYYFRLYPSASDMNVGMKKYPSLRNLNVTGGFLVDDFILGYDFIEKKIISSAKDLNKRNIFKLESPLLQTTLYKRFLKTNNPVLIYSLTYFDCITSSYQRIEVGKFGNQIPISNFFYGFQPIGIYANDISVYQNPFKFEFPKVNIGYYWFNGVEWEFDEELVGGNSEEWYVVYNDRNGNVWKQHKFELPYILYDYVKTYLSNLMDNSEETENLKTNYYCGCPWPGCSDYGTSTKNLDEARSIMINKFNSKHSPWTYAEWTSGGSK